MNSTWQATRSNFSCLEHMEDKFWNVISTVFRTNSPKSMLQHGEEAKTHFSHVSVNEVILAQQLKRFPVILWEQKVHLRVHRSSPLTPLLSHLSRVHIWHTVCLKIQFVCSAVYNLQKTMS
jgi:hypothetical protein